MEYDGLGSIKIIGCSVVSSKKFFEAHFAVGSKAYIKKKAKIGILESIIIKKINGIFPKKYTYQGINTIVSYIDTLNRVWLEEELTWEENALDDAKLHWLRLKKQLENECLLSKTIETRNTKIPETNYAINNKISNLLRIIRTLDSDQLSRLEEEAGKIKQGEN